MEHAPLRPVPARPAGPIDPATAVREVVSWLPALSPVAAGALALVVLSERPRAEAASELGVSEDELSELLAEARKELRQTIVVLGGSGWCERAERLISDRLDGDLAGRDTRRLDAHLRNCPRCVEHERRLVQATDAVVLGAGGATPPPRAGMDVAPLTEATAVPPDEQKPPAEEAAPANGGGEGAAPSAEEPSAEEPSVEEPSVEEPSVEEPSVEEPSVEEPSVEEPAVEEPSVEEAAPADGGGEGAAPSVEEPSVEEPSVEEPSVPIPAGGDQVAAAAEVLVAARTRRQIAAAVVWNSLIALAILLALATIALTIAGILGAEL